MTEPDVAKRLRRYEGAIMGQRSKTDGTRPVNPCITAREAIQLADWIKFIRGEDPPNIVILPGSECF